MSNQELNIESKQWSLRAPEKTKRSHCSILIKHTIDYFDHNTHVRFNLDICSIEGENTGDDCTVEIKCGENGLKAYYNISVCFDTGIDFLTSKEITLYDIFDKFCSSMKYCGFCIYSPTRTELTVSELKDFARSFITHLEFWEGGYINYDERHIPECWHCYRKRCKEGNFETPRVDKSNDYEVDNEDDIRDDMFIARIIRQSY